MVFYIIELDQFITFVLNKFSYHHIAGLSDFAELKSGYDVRGPDCIKSGDDLSKYTLIYLGDL